MIDRCRSSHEAGLRESLPHLSAFTPICRLGKDASQLEMKVHVCTSGCPPTRPTYRPKRQKESSAYLQTMRANGNLQSILRDINILHELLESKGYPDTAKLKAHKISTAQLSITRPLLQFVHAITKWSHVRYLHVVLDFRRAMDSWSLLESLTRFRLQAPLAPHWGA
jgi:hypothetical protein